MKVRASVSHRRIYPHIVYHYLGQVPQANREGIVVIMAVNENGDPHLYWRGPCYFARE